MIQAYLFDLDGTLIDSEVLWIEALWRVLGERGCAIALAEVGAFAYGTDWSGVFTGVEARFPGTFSTVEVMLDALTPHFQLLRANRDIRIPSSVELLVRLADEYPVAIVSGAARSDIAQSIRELDLVRYLRFFLGYEDYSPGKPHPACYLLAAQRLGLPPAACLAFEDSEVGILAAKAAGMRCVALRRTNSPSQNLTAADLVVDDLSNCNNFIFSPQRR